MSNKVDLKEQNRLVRLKMEPVYRANFCANQKLYTPGAWPGFADWKGTGKGRIAVVVAPGPSCRTMLTRGFVSVAMRTQGVDVIALNRAAAAMPRIRLVLSLTAQPILAEHLQEYYTARGTGEGTEAILPAYCAPGAIAVARAAGATVRHYLLDSVPPGKTEKQGPEPGEEEARPIVGPDVPTLASSGVVSGQAAEFCWFLDYDHILCVAHDFSGGAWTHPTLEIQRMAFLTHVVARGLEGRIWNVNTRWFNKDGPALWGGPYTLTPDQAIKKFF